MKEQLQDYSKRKKQRGIEMTDKKLIRKEQLAKATQLSQAYCQEADQQIFKQVHQHAKIKEAKMIFCYVGMANEINTQQLIEELLASGKRICVPKCYKLGVMDAFEIHSLADLELGKYDILEPKAEMKKIEPTDIDVGLIPCVTADLKGYRLGYGGGFYDRYLNRSKMYRLLMCRNELLVDNVPRESHDLPVNCLVTEELVKEFSQT